MKLFALFMATISVFLIGRSITREEWTGFHYPDPANMKEYAISKPMQSFGECVKWSITKKKDNNDSRIECGKNCKYDRELDSFICKEVY